MVIPDVCRGAVGRSTLTRPPSGEFSMKGKSGEIQIRGYVPCPEGARGIR